VTRRRLISTKWLAGTAGMVLLAACSQAETTPLPTVDGLEADRYMGTWHEIASIPSDFQKECASGSTARYARAGEMVSVRTSCPTADGGRKIVQGTARFTDGPEKGRMEVTYTRLFGWWVWPAAQDYRIVAIDPEYGWTIVGEPRRRKAWILARENRVPQDLLTELAGILEGTGYDPCDLIVTSPAQMPGRPRLCRI
jgi:apolipoprotein D and lipocalin family protein